jgi:hypothetical protein
MGGKDASKGNQVIDTQPKRRSQELFNLKKAKEHTHPQEPFNLKPGSILVFITLKTIMENLLECHIPQFGVQLCQWLCIPELKGIFTDNAVHVAIATGTKAKVNSRDQHAEKHQLINPKTGESYKTVEVTNYGCVINYLDSTRAIQVFTLKGSEAIQDLFHKTVLHIANHFAKEIQKNEEDKIKYSFVKENIQALLNSVDLDETGKAELAKRVEEFVTICETSTKLKEFKKEWICTEFVSYCLMGASYICFGPEFFKEYFGTFNPILTPAELEECLNGMFSSKVWDLNHEEGPIEIDLPVVKCCPLWTPKSPSPDNTLPRRRL